jgi:hypothetical protein
MMARVSGCMVMRPSATAMRWVAGLAATSTMWAWPWASKWVREGMETPANAWAGKGGSGAMAGLAMNVRRTEAS